MEFYCHLFIHFGLCRVQNFLLLKRTLFLVLASGPGNLPVVLVWNAKVVWFGPKSIHISNPLYLGGPNLDRCLSTNGFWGFLLDLSVPISSASVWVFLCMVVSRYSTVFRKILILVCHCLLLLYWHPSESKLSMKCFLPHPENQHQ